MADRHASILVVEDEFLIGEMIKEALEEGGLDVHMATTGDEALGYLKAGHPADILFTDINLPGTLDGAALAKRARELRPDIPVVYASGRCAALDQIASVPDSSFVPEPYSLSYVCAMLTRLAAARITAPATA